MCTIISDQSYSCIRNGTDVDDIDIICTIYNFQLVYDCNSCRGIEKMSAKLLCLNFFWSSTLKLISIKS